MLPLIAVIQTLMILQVALHYGRSLFGRGKGGGRVCNNLEFLTRDDQSCKMRQ